MHQLCWNPPQYLIMTTLFQNSPCLVSINKDLFILKHKGCVLQTIPTHSQIYWIFTRVLESAETCRHVPVVEGLLKLTRKQKRIVAEISHSEKSANGGSSLTDVWKVRPQDSTLNTIPGVPYTILQKHTWSCIFILWTNVSRKVREMFIEVVTFSDLPFWEETPRRKRN